MEYVKHDDANRNDCVPNDFLDLSFRLLEIPGFFR